MFANFLGGHVLVLSRNLEGGVRRINKRLKYSSELCVCVLTNQIWCVL